MCCAKYLGGWVKVLKSSKGIFIRNNVGFSPQVVDWNCSMKGFRVSIKSWEINENYLVETLSHHYMKFIRFVAVIIEEMSLAFWKFVWQLLTGKIPMNTVRYGMILSWRSHNCIHMLPWRNFSYWVRRVGSLELYLQSAPVGVSQWKAEDNVGTTHPTTSQATEKRMFGQIHYPHVSCAIASWKTPGNSCLPAVKTVTATFFWLFYF